MLQLIIKYVKFYGRRRVWLVVLGVAAVFAALYGSHWLAEATSRALMLPEPPNLHLEHFFRNRNLSHYLDNIQLLIEPSQVLCHDIPVVALVTSAPMNMDARDAIRHTWAKHLPTYFVLGIIADDHLVHAYMEAKQHSDIIVYDLHDHYQNLTLKTALMLQWASQRCAAAYVLKTDDDVLVNPWTLEKVIEDKAGSPLIGFRVSGSRLHRDAYNKWFVPRALRRADAVARYLSGTGYLLRGENIKGILRAAYKVPLMNLEDVYFTYLVSALSLHLPLAHEARLSPHRPWFSFACAYWGLALMHSFTPDEIVHAWTKIQSVAEKSKQNSNVCSVLGVFSKDMFLY